VRRGGQRPGERSAATAWPIALSATHLVRRPTFLEALSPRPPGKLARRAGTCSIDSLRHERCRWRNALARAKPFATPSRHDRYFRIPTGWNRREPAIGDRVRGEVERAIGEILRRETERTPEGRYCVCQGANIGAIMPPSPSGPDRDLTGTSPRRAASTPPLPHGGQCARVGLRGRDLSQTLPPSGRTPVASGANHRGPTRSAGVVDASATGPTAR
jgi:hypothetical protein